MLYDPIQNAITQGAIQLLIPVGLLRRVLQWVAGLPEGVRHELLRQEVVEVERRRVLMEKSS
jgi:hypothetical protein